VRLGAVSKTPKAVQPILVMRNYRNPLMSSHQSEDPPTIRWNASGQHVEIIDQRHLPYRLVVEDVRTVSDVVEAIRDMKVRGAPLIGALAAFGAYFAWRDSMGEDDGTIAAATIGLKAARPTAVNLAWAVDRVMDAARNVAATDRAAAALQTAEAIVQEELERSRLMGVHGLPLISAIAARKSGSPVNVLTHCNAGRLACIDYGTATAPIYLAHQKGLPIHVWVDETRPRNQGARLTAWELGRRGVSHTVIVDNVGGHLMQNGLVDIVIVGTDRTTRNGDVVNKIGTYLKALAAADSGIPFYVALPSSSIDWSLASGAEVPIEVRGPDEVRTMTGAASDGSLHSVDILPKGSNAVNYAFDVTPAKYVTGLITERGICEASEASLRELFPDVEIH